MPVIKTKILNKEINLKFENNESERIHKALGEIKKNLKKFEQTSSNNDETNILIQALLELQDKFFETNKDNETSTKKNELKQIDISKLKKINFNQTDEINLLKDKIELLEKKNKLLDKSLTEMVNQIKLISNLIIKNYD